MNNGPHLPSKHRSQAGFTLIELMVGLTILVLMTGLGIAALIRQQDRQTSLQTARSIQNMLRVARAKAQAKDTPVACQVVDDSLLAVQVSYNAVTETFSIQAICQSGPEDYPSTPRYTIPENITAIVGDITSNPIQFNVLSGGTNLGTDMAIIIDSRTDTDFSFRVGTRGRIDEGDFCTVPSGGSSCTPL